MKCLLHRVHSLFGDMDSIIRNGNSALSKSNGGGRGKKAFWSRVLKDCQAFSQRKWEGIV